MRSRSRAGVLVAQAVGEVGEPLVEPLQRRAVEQVVELLLRAAAERARGALGVRPPPQRPVRRRQPAHDDLLPAPPQVDVALGRRLARVGRRAQLADQPHLLERGGELRAEHAPLDPLDRVERHLDRGPLPAALEVRAQPRAQVARLADVEHLVVAVAEEVDAGPLGRAVHEPPLAVHAPRPRRRQLLELGDRAWRRAPARARAARTNTSAVACASGSARWHGSTDTPKKNASEARLVRSTRPRSRLRASGTVSITVADEPLAGQPLELAR